MEQKGKPLNTEPSRLNGVPFPFAWFCFLFLGGFYIEENALKYIGISISNELERCAFMSPSFTDFCY